MKLNTKMLLTVILTVFVISSARSQTVTVSNASTNEVNGEYSILGGLHNSKYEYKMGLYYIIWLESGEVGGNDAGWHP